MGFLRKMWLNFWVAQKAGAEIVELKQKLKEEQDLNDHLNFKVNALYTIVDALAIEMDGVRGLLSDVSEQNRLLAGALRQLANAHTSASSSTSLGDPRSKKIPGDDKPN